MVKKFIIGQVGAPFGVKGFVRIRSGSGETGHLSELQSVVVSKDGNEKRLQIEECRDASAGHVLMRFKGIDSPEAAKTLTGAQLIVDRDQAAPLGEGEFYIEDLKGLAVVSAAGETVGSITDIIEGGGGELAEVKLINGEKRLVPFRKEFFAEISPRNDPREGRLVLQNLWVLE